MNDASTIEYELMLKGSHTILWRDGKITCTCGANLEHDCEHVQPVVIGYLRCPQRQDEVVEKIGFMRRNKTGQQASQSIVQQIWENKLPVDTIVRMSAATDIFAGCWVRLLPDGSGVSIVNGKPIHGIALSTVRKGQKVEFSVKYTEPAQPQIGKKRKFRLE